jgi:subtilase family serine protease
MGLIHRPIRATGFAVLGLALTLTVGAFASSGAAAAQTPHVRAFVALRDSVTPTTDRVTGSYHSAKMAIEVALAPRNQTALNKQIRAIYTRGSRQYHHWLAKGQFDQRYAPAASKRAAVAGYLRANGLTLERAPSPFLIRAYGTSQQISAAFRTTLRDYADPRGIRYFANSAPVHLPAAIATGVQGVIGLSSSVRERPMYQLPPRRALLHRTSRAAGAQASCENGYPSAQTLFNFFNNGVGFSAGYGGAPGCNGLTPSQLNSLYGAPNVGPRGKGRGVTIGVFELSAYQQSDIDTYARTFYGPAYTPPLHNILVDGGPQNPVCPVGDTCLPASEAYAGDIEVDADIETELAMAPDVKSVEVYEAPNDTIGLTNVDLDTAIAQQDTADVISSSWAECENDIGASVILAESTPLEQMAMQGQSFLSSAGDTGAFECIRSSGTVQPNVLDPSSQPWVTAVGGTSFESDNPGTNPTPAYPVGVESVWNVDNLCNTSADEGNFSGYFWCAETGAGGGGNSQFWGRPFYQVGPGVTSKYSTTGNGTTQCSFAAVGTPCREVPDISANADEFTPYGEYCTANANTPGSACGFSAGRTPPGWFGIGGTSLSSPLWAGIVADRDSFQGFRSGNINPLLYLLYNVAPNVYFHDINGSQPTNNNGLFPALPGYDLATGIGTPKMAALITETF